MSDAGSVPPSGIELAIQCKRTPGKSHHSPPRNSEIPRNIPVISVIESGGLSSTDFSTTITKKAPLVGAFFVIAIRWNEPA